MKILVVNGSPRGDKGNTHVLVKAFLEGAQQAGAESETIYLKDKTIKHCTGCFGCWFKTPGECIHKDDMPELLLKVRESDVIVFATPLYVYTVTGLMKDFMDRLIPIAQPFMDIEDGLINHPPRYPNDSLGLAVVISTCGFPETQHFSGFKETFRCWLRGGSISLAGMICCAGGSVLQTPHLKDAVNWYVDATRQAGRELVESGRVSDQMQSVLDRPLIEDQQLFADKSNEYFTSLGLTRL